MENTINTIYFLDDDFFLCFFFWGLYTHTTPRSKDFLLEGLRDLDLFFCFCVSFLVFCAGLLLRFRLVSGDLLLDRAFLGELVFRIGCIVTTPRNVIESFCFIFLDCIPYALRNFCLETQSVFKGSGMIFFHLPTYYNK